MPDFLQREILPRTPLNIDTSYRYQSKYFVVRLSLIVAWFVRLFSISEWLMAFFQVRSEDGKFHTHPLAGELYILALTAMPPLVLSGAINVKAGWVVCISVLLIIDITRHNTFQIIIRPLTDKAYKQYSYFRTFVLTVLSYFNINNLFAILYLSIFDLEFGNTPLAPISAWSTSTGIITGTGYSGINPNRGSYASLVCGAESLVGLLFISTIVGLMLARFSKKVEELESDSAHT